MFTNWKKTAPASVISMLLSQAAFGQAQTSSTPPRPELVLRSGHSEWIQGLAYSPDGKSLASLGSDQQVIIWDTQSGYETRRFTINKTYVYPGPISFSADSAQLFWGDAQTVRARPVRATASPEAIYYESATVHAIDPSPDGKWLAVGDEQGKIVLHPITHPESATALASIAEGITCLRFSSDSQLLVAGTSKGTVVTLDVPSKSIIQKTKLFQFTDSVAIDVDKHVLAAGADLTTSPPITQVTLPENWVYQLAVWDVTANKAVAMLRGSDVVRSRLDPRGKSILTSVRTGEAAQLKLLLRPVDNLQAAAAFEVEDRFTPFYDFAFGLDGKLLAAVDKAAEIRVMETDTRHVRPQFAGPVEGVVGMSHPPGYHLIVAGHSGLSSWNMRQGEMDYVYSSHAIAQSPDQEWLAYFDFANKFRAFQRGREVPINLKLSNPKYSATIMAISQGAAKIFWAEGDTATTRPGAINGGAYYVSARSEGLETTSLCGEHETPYRFGASASVKFIAVQCRISETTFSPLRIQSGPSLDKLATFPYGAIDSVSFSADERFVTATEGSTIHIIDLRELKPITDLQTAKASEFRRIGSVVFHPPSLLSFVSTPLYINTGQEGGRVETWDWISKIRLNLIPPTPSGFTSVAVSPLGGIFAGNADGSTYIYDYATRALLGRLIFVGRYGWLVVTPDGLFDGSADAMAFVGWRSGGGQVVPLDAFFGDFYHPGLLADLMSDNTPKADVDIATVVQIPALRTMLAQKQAHLEDHGGHVVVCFEQKPGAVINVDPADQRVVFPTVNGYQVGTTSTCKFEKALPGDAKTHAGLIRRLQNWKPKVVTTPWDNKMSETKESTLHVLTIGISRYDEGRTGFRKLPYAVPSAKALETFFREQQGRSKKAYAAIRVWDGLYDSDATGDRVRKSLGEIAKVARYDDVVLVYLAGHGKVSPGQEMFYFVPADGKDTDADGTELRTTGLNTAMLAQALRDLPSRRIVLIIDACQSGGAIEALAKIGSVKARVERWRIQLDRPRPGYEPASGVHLIAATVPVSYAVGLPEGESALATTLLQKLRTATGPITIEQVAGYLRAELPNASKSMARGFAQVPLISSIGADFIVAVN